MSHQTWLVLAEELYPERLPGDEPEELEVLPWKLDALHDLMLREDCSEGRSLAALFIGALISAGIWMAVVYGLAGLRDYQGRISFNPTRIAKDLRFKLTVRGCRLMVDIRGQANVVEPAIPHSRGG